MLEGFLGTTGAFIVVLGVVVFVHEFGHLLAAKAFGMRAYVFSLGFGTRLFGFKWGETDCRVSLIPLGGYVKLEGEGDDGLTESVEGRGDGKDFLSRPRWQRFLVYFAGPAMNGVLTVAVLTGLFMVGFQVDAALYAPPVVGAVDPEGPGARAGVQPGDRILAVDDVPVATWEDAGYQVLLRPKQEFPLRLQRGGTTTLVDVRAAAFGKEKVGTIGVFPLVQIGRVMEGSAAAAAGLREDDAVLRIDGQAIRGFGDIPPLVQAAKDRPLELELLRDGAPLALAVQPKLDGGVPRLGIGPKLITQQFGFARSVREAIAQSWAMTKQTFEVLGRLVTAQLSPKTMMGPIGIAQASGEAAREGGLLALMRLIAIISLQVGLFNLIVPIPVLDAGQMAMLAVEGVIGRDLPQRLKDYILNAGVIAVLLLVCLVLYSDLSKTSFLGKYLP